MGGIGVFLRCRQAAVELVQRAPLCGFPRRDPKAPAAYVCTSAWPARAQPAARTGGFLGPALPHMFAQAHGLQGPSPQLIQAGCWALLCAVLRILPGRQTACPCFAP